MIILVSTGCYSGWDMVALATTEEKLREGLLKYTKGYDEYASSGYTSDWAYISGDAITFLTENGYATEADLPKLHVADYDGEWSDQLKEFLK